MAHTRYEGRWPGAYIISDDVHLSREVITFAEGAILQPGTVLGAKKSDGSYAPFNPAATDGTETASAICYDHVDAAQSAVKGVITMRDSAVKASELLWPDSITEAQKTKAIADLAEKTIIPR